MVTWNAYLCGSKTRYVMAIMESLDEDTETRRLSPVALLSGGYVDLINGPQDHGWCSGYTCRKRLSTFMALLPLGEFLAVTPVQPHLLTQDGLSLCSLLPSVTRHVRRFDTDCYTDASSLCLSVDTRLTKTDFSKVKEQLTSPQVEISFS